MIRILNYKITKSDDTFSILGFLRSRGYSRSLIAHLKRTPEGILRNTVWARIHEPLLAGDLLTVTISECNTSDILPAALPFPVIYEDEDLMIINKPAGMPTHPSQGHRHDTLANAAAYYLKEKNQDFIYRCLNRLDRDTTGLLILAKHAYSASLLSSMIRQRLIRREYWAVAKGNVPAQGTIKAPIGRCSDSTIERRVDYQNGAHAITHFKCIKQKNGHSLVSLTLDTGRTHQIRVHMKHLGHPLPGDFLYCPDYCHITRQALHSRSLTFSHPITGMPLTFTAKLPEDMESLLT